MKRKSKILCLSISLLIGINTLFAQNELNAYKYIMVPTSFDYFNEPDKYQINSLTQFLFNKYGFTAIMDNETYPLDLGHDKCLGLTAYVVRSNTMLKTKLNVELRDCFNQVIYTSRVGESRSKEFKKAYHEALRSAFKSFEAIQYKYAPSDTPEKINAAVTKTETIEDQVKQIDVNTTAKKEAPKPEIAVPNRDLKKVKSLPDHPASLKVLYAQSIQNGFQLVDSAPQVIMILLHTGKTDTYIVKGRDAIVYKEDGFWYISENKGTDTKTERITIKF